MNSVVYHEDEGNKNKSILFDPSWGVFDLLIGTKITSTYPNAADMESFPIEKIDWTSLDIAEDYYVNLQLLTMGYQNKVSLMYRTNPSETQAKGGCSTFRSLEIHNESMRELQRRFPQFVKLREKIAKNSGEWSNKVKLAATISWKEAYKSSQVSTITDFMV